MTLRDARGLEALERDGDFVRAEVEVGEDERAAAVRVCLLGNAGPFVLQLDASAWHGEARRVDDGAGDGADDADLRAGGWRVREERRGHEEWD